MVGTIKRNWLAGVLIIWSMVLLGKEALGSVTVGGWFGVGIMWLAFRKWKWKSWPILIILGLLNLHINNLFGIEGWLKFNFDLEKINITNPAYLKIIDGYWHENLLIPYKLRNILYSSWMLGFLWVDSVLKLMSVFYWISLWGWGLCLIIGLGVEKLYQDKKLFWPMMWVGTVVITSGLGIMIDTKKSLVLILPVIILLIVKAVKNKRVERLKWVLLILLVIDVLTKL